MDINEVTEAKFINKLSELVHDLLQVGFEAKRWPHTNKGVKALKV
jgi:hypothetical protein